MRVLLAESNKDVADLLRHKMQRHGYDVDLTETGAEILEMHPKYDLLLLDLDLSDIDGVEVCRAIREVSEMPIIALTEQDAELVRVLCLMEGCDDCLTKPYGFRELLARIEAVMRRVRHRPTSVQRISRGPLSIDRGTREVRLNGELVTMTRREFNLLYVLASQPETVLSRERLMAEVWGQANPSPFSGRKGSRTIDTHVNAVRNKLGNNGWIVTVRGVGFRFGGH
ncbi:response regulator transcription factor [Streptomyces avermitilis]|uniref:response regulator transcription factor n=1 Tax=Streptomyces avermitilis TaxID=33903 RepID=UPI003719AF40